jgi:hypothetical protein
MRVTGSVGKNSEENRYRRNPDPVDPDASSMRVTKEVEDQP